MAQIKQSRLSGRILKLMSIFSGVQFVQIVCSIVRTKLIALWIGPVGVGLFAIYTTAVETLSQFFQVAMDQSSMREVAIAKTEHTKLSAVIRTIRRWSLWLAIAGMVIMVALSPWLSRVMFNDDNHALSFILLSAAVFFRILTCGENPVLQGLERFKALATASLWGAIGGVAVSIPLFYFWGIDSILPALLSYTAITTGALLLQRRRNDTAGTAPLPSREIFRQGLPMIKFGIYLALAAFIGMAANFIFVSYLNHQAGTEFTGFYNTGYSIIVRYVGPLFTAISLEFYPRLVSVRNHRLRTSTFVNHEILLLLLIITPIALWMITFDNVAIQLLYSDEFLIASPIITWGMAGTILRVSTWCISYVIISRGEQRLYLLTESLSALFAVVFNIVGYNLRDLEGIGIAYLLWYLSDTVLLLIIYNRHFKLHLSGKVISCLGGGVALAVTAILLKSYTASAGNPLAGTVINATVASVLTVGCFLSLNRLRRRSGKKRKHPVEQIEKEPSGS